MSIAHRFEEFTFCGFVSLSLVCWDFLKLLIFVAAAVASPQLELPIAALNFFRSTCTIPLNWLHQIRLGHLFLSEYGLFLLISAYTCFAIVCAIATPILYNSSIWCFVYECSNNYQYTVFGIWGNELFLFKFSSSLYLSFLIGWSYLNSTPVSKWVVATCLVSCFGFEKLLVAVLQKNKPWIVFTTETRKLPSAWPLLGTLFQAFD